MVIDKVGTDKALNEEETIKTKKIHLSFQGKNWKYSHPLFS